MIVLTIPNDAILRQLTLVPDALGDVMQAGQILVEMSTVSPEMRASAPFPRPSVVPAPISSSLTSRRLIALAS